MDEIFFLIIVDTRLNFNVLPAYKFSYLKIF